MMEKCMKSTGSGDDNRFVSWMGPVDLQTGKGERKIILGKQYFGEGISIFNGKIYQLTYQNHIGFVYDAKTYKKISEFSFPGEGWSLTHDSTNLIMSDGTSKLQYLDPNTLKVIKIVGVEDNNGPVGNINELEYINGYIYANRWYTNEIVKIDTANGHVVGKIDLSNLDTEVKRKYTGAETANGIAYDEASGKMYVTGKCWPNLYEIKIN
jgi:glutamine cyclotransferase